MALKPQISKKGACCPHEVWRGWAWDLSSSSPSHPPDRIFLPNLDLIAKLDQEEKQWEADLCSPNGEGFHSGENCKGDRRVKRAQDMPQEDGNAWEEQGSEYLVLACMLPAWTSSAQVPWLQEDEYLSLSGWVNIFSFQRQIPCQLLMTAIASWLKSPSQEKKTGMGDKFDAELD